MTTPYEPPPDDQPIALRLVPLLHEQLNAKYLVSCISQPIDYNEYSEFFPMVIYQWVEKGKPTEKPPLALRHRLLDAAKAETLRDFIAALPPNLFTYPKQIEFCLDLLYEAATESGRPPYHARPDWHPTLHGFEDLIEACPQEIRTICPVKSILKHTPREQGKTKSLTRNQRIWDQGREMRNATASTWDEIGKKLKSLQEFESLDIAASTFATIAKRKQRPGE